MSETGFVPGQMRVAEPEPEEGADGQNRRALFALAGVAVAVVLVIVAWLLFFSGGDEATPVAAPAPPVSQPVVPTAAPSPAEVTTTSARTKHGFRDPFKALIQPAAAGAAGSSTTTATVTTGSTTTGSATSASAASGVGASSGPTTPDSSSAHTLKVVSVSARNASITIKVDGTTYKNLKAGQVFAKYFKVIGIGGPVNVVQFGDEKFNVSGTKAITLAS
jgi:hypothetical protein